MAQDQLIQETNEVLKKILEIEEQKRAKVESLTSERSTIPDLQRPGNETKEEDLEKRMKAAQDQSRENMRVIQERSKQYQEDVLNELRIQNDLLRQIFEKLR
jgi:hypothetical protein